MEYLIVESADDLFLCRKVSSLMGLGFIPQGGLCVTAVPSGRNGEHYFDDAGLLYSQAMISNKDYTDDEHNEILEIVSGL
jgi:hypothetical protein